MQNVKTIVREIFPQPIYQALRTMYRVAKPVDIGSPQATVYINNDTTETYIGVNNYFSWLAADAGISASVEIDFYHHDGRYLFSHRDHLAHFHSRSINVAQLFREHGVQSSFGMFSVAVAPRNRWSPTVKEMGALTGIFYTFHRDRNGSVALMHPNARIGKVSPMSSWASLQVISTFNLKEIVLYQLNAGNYAHSTVHRLISKETSEELMSVATSYKPMQTHRIVFDLKSAKSLPSHLLLRADSLPSSNAKPLLQRTYSDGLFTISHS